MTAYSRSVLPVDGTPSLDPFGLLQPQVTHTFSATPVAPIIPHAPPSSATAIAHQIAAAMADLGPETGPMELALDPPELGRLRLQITEVAGVLTLSIHADRPETVDLMRRHLDLLAQEFARSGLDAPSVRIAQDDGGGGNSARHGAPRGGDDADTNETAAPQPERTVLRVTADGGLDIRV
ncbi:flagellar hook-length control protein FliK [Hasllibacter sp. MH4015]|uniref:flagellar hook-length control protein FliK n=1 Tax=Hasllibacter sp. MH4015 TaxID=2854029 RepID=UPI001CD5307E|nr:flagellar hook-length control protein FliK [Hasllibacter sp. MH4015]